jgi:hypothetical protein
MEELRDTYTKCIISSFHRHKHNILLHISVLCGELFDEAVSDTTKLAPSKQMPALRERCVSLFLASCDRVKESGIGGNGGSFVRTPASRFRHTGHQQS